MPRITLLMMIALALLLVSVVGPAVAAEPPVDVPDGRIEALVAAAPALPVDLGLDLRLRLVDYIDATNPDTPHPMMDQGTSSVVDGPAGRYRVTAKHRHAFFAYRWRSAGRAKPHMLVFEYPDDAVRQIGFFLHESRFDGGINNDWSLETGVFTGNPYPLSGKMQYHTFIYWPTDAWPVALASNFNRFGEPAAVSRIWVYEIEGGLPALEVKDVDAENPRMLGSMINWSLVAMRGAFGLAGRDASIAHIIEYYKYLGQNVVSWPVVSNNGWGFKARIDAWDGDDKTDELGATLKAFDEAGMKFIAIFSMARTFTIGGKAYTQENRQEYREGLLKGYDEFLTRYGHHPSLYGIAFDPPDLSPRYGNAQMDTIRELMDGDIGKFTAFIHQRKPELKIFAFVGSPSIHLPYFTDPGEVLGQWLKSGQSWQNFLAEDARKRWAGWHRDPAALAKVPGLTVVYQYHHDDHAIYDSYYRQPRSMTYYDMERSQAKSDLHDTRAVMLFNTFFEGHIGLWPGNFWYRKLWVAPDFNPAEPSASAAWALAMAHRDRNMVMAGAWNRKGAGLEASLRRFARAYRALPPVELQAVEVKGTTPVLARRGVYRDTTFVSLLNPTPFETTVNVQVGQNQQQALTLVPFEMQTITQPGDQSAVVGGDAAAAYVTWLKRRLQEYQQRMATLRALDAEAVDEALVQHLAAAQRLFDGGQYYQMDVTFGHALSIELDLRARVLQPTQLRVPLLAEAPAAGIDLDAWPKAAADVRAESAESIATHLFFPNSWSGPADFSARVRLGHDGKRLYFALAVTDDKITGRDVAALLLAPTGYRDFRPDVVPWAHRLSLPVPHEADVPRVEGKLGLVAAARRTDAGYIVEGSISLAELNLASGGRMAWGFEVGDDDDTPNLARAGWARKTAIMLPNTPTFTYWDDARTGGELILE